MSRITTNSKVEQSFELHAGLQVMGPIILDNVLGSMYSHLIAMCETP